MSSRREISLRSIKVGRWVDAIKIFSVTFKSMYLIIHAFIFILLLLFGDQVTTISSMAMCISPLEEISILKCRW